MDIAKSYERRINDAVRRIDQLIEERDRLRERAERAERELAAVIEMHISPNEDGIWYLDLPISAHDPAYHYQTSHEAAVGVVRMAAGLDAAPAGEETPP
jgi:hypothetical protein